MGKTQAIKFVMKSISKMVTASFATGICLVLLFPNTEAVLGSRLRAGTSDPAEKKFRVLHVMSYHTPWKWTDDLLDGFKDVLKDLNVEYRVFEMDTKRRSSEEWKEQAGRQESSSMPGSRIWCIRRTITPRNM